MIKLGDLMRSGLFFLAVSLIGLGLFKLHEYSYAKGYDSKVCEVCKPCEKIDFSKLKFAKKGSCFITINEAETPIDSIPVPAIEIQEQKKKRWFKRK